jgi:alcohol dehydrogenase
MRRLYDTIELRPHVHGDDVPSLMRRLLTAPIGYVIRQSDMRTTEAVVRRVSNVRRTYNHPDLILSAPRAVMVSAALDSLSLAIEGLTSRSGDPLADAQLMHAVRLLGEHLPRLASDDDLAAHAALMYAAVLCGLGSEHIGAGMATVLGHAIGARHEADNGSVKAIVLLHVLGFNADAAQAGLLKVAASLGLARSGGGSHAAAVISALAAFLRRLDTPVRLRDVGLTKDALPELPHMGWAIGSYGATLGL